MRSKEKVTLKWSKKENDWISKYPKGENNSNGKVVGYSFFHMIRLFDDWIGEEGKYKDIRDYLDKGGFDPDTFSITVHAKKKD